MNLLKKARLAKGMTQTDIAKQLGVTVVTISKWESGITFPTPRRLKKAAHAYGVSVEDLISEKVG